MNRPDDDTTITCGQCGETSPLLDWTETPVSGQLPRGVYQCPKCNHAFQRVQTGDEFHPMKLEPVSPVL